jgi:hypothetical protein
MGMAINAIAAALRLRSLMRCRLVMVVRVDRMIDCFCPMIPNHQDSKTTKANAMPNQTPTEFTQPYA